MARLEELYKQRSALNEQIALAQEEAVKNGETIVIDGQTIDATMNYEGELGDPLLTDRIPLFRKDANADIVESGEIVIQDFFDKFGADAAGKIAQFNENAEEKTTAFNSNAESKVADFNANATEKKSDFDSNAESKVTVFNSNATDKTNTFDSNATAKTNAFNQNATSKEAELEDALDEYTTAKKGELDTYTNDKKSDFDSNATAKTTAFNENAEEKIEQVTEIADEVVNANIQNALTQLTALIQQMQSVPQTAHYLPVQVESTLYALSLSEDATGIYVELNEIEEEEVGGETA